MPLFDPLSRYRADSTTFQSIDLVAGAAGVISLSGLGSVDDASVAIDLGSNVFRFYGAAFSGNNQLFISSNGLISFGAAETSPYNDTLSQLFYYIAPLWDNWVTNRNSSIDDLVLAQFQDLNGDDVADQLVIEWNNVYHAEVPEADGASFQLILSLNTGASNGDIVFNYADLAVDGDSGDSNYNNGGNATIGIRSGQPGTDFTQLLIGANGETVMPVNSGTAIRISAVPNPPSPSPALVKDINSLRLGSNPSDLTVFNGALFFVADNGYSGRELQRVNSAGKISLVKDINVGPYGADVKCLTVVGGSLFFFANDATNGWGLWKSDGTEDGTRLVASVSSTIPGWNDPSTVAASGGKFFFRGFDETNGLELWVSDGTAAGTLRISNIEPGYGWSHASNLTDVNGTLYFTAETTTGGRELYKSNGTAATTLLVRAIAAGNTSSDPEELINLNGTLYFTANDGTGRELWRSTGSGATTTMVRNINANAGVGSNPLNLTILGNTLYFFADSGTGYQLWKSDGSSIGTVRVSTTVFRNDYWSNDNFNLFNLNGTLYFSSQGDSTTELWKSDGSSVTKVADLPSYYSYISEFTNVGGQLYFRLGDGDATTGRELWKSDGSAAGTALVRDVLPGTVSSNPKELTSFNNKLYFIADSDDIYHQPAEVWSSDGTAAGTQSLDVEPVTLGASISDLQLFNGKLFFAANDGVLGKELWTSDGTTAGTLLVKDLRQGSYGSDIRALTSIGSNLYFFAIDDLNDYGLWKSDGTAAGTSLIKALDSWSYSYSPIIQGGSRFYFTARDVNGIELWSSDGTTAGTAMVKNINPGAADSSPYLWDQAVLGRHPLFHGLQHHHRSRALENGRDQCRHHARAQHRSRSC